MADQEVIKHVKSAIATARDKKKSWKHKLQEILLEVAIIVFAVSLSIWLHGWAEGLKDRREEREFLVGLKEDLKSNIEEMKSDIAAYQLRLSGTHYFERFVNGGPWSQDSMKQYLPTFLANARFNPRGSRFEALKGSGRLGIVGNKELLLHVTELYTKDFQVIHMVNDEMNTFRQQLLVPFIMQHLKVDAAGMGSNWQEVLKMDQMRAMIFQGEGALACIQVYSDGVKKCEGIVREIEEEIR